MANSHCGASKGWEWSYKTSLKKICLNTILASKIFNSSPNSSICTITDARNRKKRWVFNTFKKEKNEENITEQSLATLELSKTIKHTPHIAECRINFIEKERFSRRIQIHFLIVNTFLLHIEHIDDHLKCITNLSSHISVLSILSKRHIPESSITNQKDTAFNSPFSKQLDPSFPEQNQINWVRLPPSLNNRH